MPATLLTLFVAVPLAGAGLAVLLRHDVAQRVLHLGIALLSTLGGLWLIVTHASTPVLAHNVGAFVPGVAIPFVSDSFAALMLTVTGVTTTAAAAYAWRTGEARLRFFTAMALMLTAGVNGALLTGDIFNLFVFIEVMLLPSYALIAMTGSWRRLGIGRMYVVVNLVTSAILLIGVGFVYGAAGTVNLAALAGRGGEDGTVALGTAIVLLALAVKAGIVPLHGWLPRAYPATSAAVMGLFSALHTKVALYAIYRVHSVVDGGELTTRVLLVLAAVTMLVGAFSSLGERGIRRSLSFQMVAGIGYITLGLAIATRLGLAAGIFYMVHHIVVMGGLILTAGAIEQTYRTGRYDRLSGLLKRDPWVAVVFVLGLFSLVGLPPSSGLFAKVAIVGALGDLDNSTGWILIGVVIVASLGSLLAMQKLWVGVFWGPPMEEGSTRVELEEGERPAPTDLAERRVRLRLLAPGAALVALSLVIFVAAGPIHEVALRAADALQDLAPYVEAVMQ